MKKKKAFLDRKKQGGLRGRSQHLAGGVVTKEGEGPEHIGDITKRRLPQPRVLARRSEGWTLFFIAELFSVKRHFSLTDKNKLVSSVVQVVLITRL